MNYYNYPYTNDINAKAKDYLIPGMDWQDIAQELDIALWHALPKFRGLNQAQERTYAQRVMRNRIFDLHKAAVRQKRHIDSNHLTFSELEETEAGSWLIETAKPLQEWTV